MSRCLKADVTERPQHERMIPGRTRTSPRVAVVFAHSRRERHSLAMGTQDRDWCREERKRKRKLYWNERTGELEYDHPRSRPRWRWPYRLRADLPWWVKELVRQTLFWGVLALLYLAWTRIGQ